MGCRQVSIASRNIEGHILPFHSVCLPQVHDQRQMIQRSLSKPHIQLGFFIQSLSSIVPGSPSHFDGSRASCPDPLVILAALRHRARIL
ncbi:hypothetical protein AAG906_005459 [Vitis piasezkii]